MRVVAVARARKALGKRRFVRRRRQRQRRRHGLVTPFLFLAVQSNGQDRIIQDREVRLILQEVELSSHRGSIAFKTRWAEGPLDLLRELRRLKPTVVHLSGHSESSGLRFQDVEGRTHLVTADALGGTFSSIGPSVKLLVLRATYDEKEAEALRAYVDCVVWIGGGIDDHSARSFEIGFYGALLEHESVAAAHKQGEAAIGLDGQLDPDQLKLVIHDQLKLLIRDGVDARKLVLVGDAPPEQA